MARVHARGVWPHTVLGLCLAVSAALVMVPGGHGAVSSPTALASSQSFTTLFGERRPRDASSRRTTSTIEVGTRFSPRVAGAINGVRMWKPKGGAGRRVAFLRDAQGAVLARAPMKARKARGWQRVLFTSPVTVTADERYVVSFRLSSGRRTLTRVRGMKSASDDLALLGAVSRRRSLSTLPATRQSAQVWVDALFAPRQQPAPPPTTPVRPSECAPVPSACGYPDATNTGVPDGTVLTAVPGQITSGTGWSWNPAYNSVFVTGAGAVLDHLDIAGGVAIGAADVTLSNSRISACGGGDDSDVVAIRYRPSEGLNASGAKILHNDINGTPEGCSRRARSGVRDVYGSAPNALVQGNDIYGAGNGITIEYQGLVADNWVHDLGHVAGDHHSGISNHGGAVGVVIRHNTVLLHGQQFAGGGGVSGALTVYSDFAHAQNVTLEDNLISGGSYVVYGGDSGDASDQYGPATNIKILSNRFVCGDWLYGPLMAFSRGSAGNELAGNVCDVTGAPVRT